MQNNISSAQKIERFKQYFLLKFTQELIKHSATGEVLELQKVLKKENEIPEKSIPKQILKNNSIKKDKEKYMKNYIPITPKPIQKKIQKQIPRRLTIPEPRLPPDLQYLQPSPTEREIFLGKLDVLVKDPQIRIIECTGAEKPIIVKGSMGVKNTNITLTEKEIKDIIQKFSEESNIPAQEGLFKVAFGKLIFSAIISDVIQSKFSIQKMKYYNPQQNISQSKKV